MASGSISKSFSTGYKLIADWVSTQNVSANTSTVTVTLKLYCPYALSVGSRSSQTVVINGTSYSYTAAAVSTSSAGTFTLGSVTSNAISHNSDGSKSIDITANYAINATISGTYYGTQTATGTAALDTIPRTSTVSATSANIGSSTTITISKASSSFTHTLTYSFAGSTSTALTGTIATKTSNSSVSWVVPTTFYAKIPSAKSGTVTITCETFSGSTSLGTKTCTFTATAAESNCKPTLAPTIVDTNSVTTALTGDSSKLVKYYSTAVATINATANNSATISSRKITNGSNSSTSTSLTVSNVENNSFTFRATDSRGYTTTSTKTATMINYVKLTCNVSVKVSTDGVMSFTISGNYFNGSFGAVSNTLIVWYRYKADSGSWSSWSTLTATLSGNTYTASGSVSGLDYQTTYVFEGCSTDKLMGDVYAPEAKTSAKPIFDWGEDDFNINVAVGTLKKEFVRDTSNAIKLFEGFDSDGSTQHFTIGAHNTGGGGGTGAIYIIPKPIDTDEWNGTNGLYIGDTNLKFNNNTVLDSSNYTSYTLKAGGSLTGAIKTSATGSSKGYFLMDKAGVSYPLGVDNGTNLWIGATSTASTHHTGQTYISAGHNGTSGNATIFVSVPNADNNGGTNYGVLHSGNWSSYALSTESWSTTLSNSSSTHTCSKTPKIIIVNAVYGNYTSYMTTGIWLASTSGKTDMMYSNNSNGSDTFACTVTVSGKNVTVKREGSYSITYYVTVIG